jgi:hypothetical protein
MIKNLEAYINTAVLMFWEFWGKHEMGTHLWWYKKSKPLTSTHEANSDHAIISFQKVFCTLSCAQQGFGLGIQVLST